MKYNIDGEQITLRYFTNIDDKETKEIEEIIETHREKLRKANIPFVLGYFFLLLASIILIFFGIKLPELFIGVGVIAIVFVWIELVRRAKVNHLMWVIKVLKDMKKIAINNDQVRHNEKIRFTENLRLQELSGMKQEELNVIYEEKNKKTILPPKPKKT